MPISESLLASLTKASMDGVAQETDISSNHTFSRHSDAVWSRYKAL